MTYKNPIPYLSEDNERVPDLAVVLGLEACDDRLGQPEVPLVTHVPVVLIVQSVHLVGQILT